MEYMFLLYRDESQPMTPEEGQIARQRQWSIMDDTRSKGILRACSPLKPSSAAITVRTIGDHTVITDGPFAETKEALGGYYIIDCQDGNEAKYWAGRLSQTGCARTVEIRELLAIPGRVECEAVAEAMTA